MSHPSQWRPVIGGIDYFHRAALRVYVHVNGSAALIELWGLDEFNLPWWGWQLNIGGEPATRWESGGQFEAPFASAMVVLEEAMH